MKLKAPSWSGKADEAAMYLTKFKAMCECSGLGDAIVPGVTLMTTADYLAATDMTSANVKLFEKNRKACAIFILGQESAHGVAMQTTVCCKIVDQNCVGEVVSFPPKRMRIPKVCYGTQLIVPNAIA